MARSSTAFLPRRGIIQLRLVALLLVVASGVFSAQPSGLGSLEIYVIDVETFKVIDVMNFLPPGFRQVDVTPVGLVITADGKTAYVSLGRANHVAFVDVATREIEFYVLVGSRAWNVTLSADESTLFVANGLSDDVSIVDIAAKKVIKSIPTGRIPYQVLLDE